MAAYEHCTVEKDGKLLIVTINRPDRMNAVHPPANEELAKVFDDFAADPDLWVAIITGAGDRAFCTGGDLKQRNDMTDAAWRKQHQLAEEVLLVVKDFPRPVIAAVEGHAHGGVEKGVMEPGFALPEGFLGLLSLGVIRGVHNQTGNFAPLVLYGVEVVTHPASLVVVLEDLRFSRAKRFLQLFPAASRQI